MSDPLQQPVPSGLTPAAEQEKQRFEYRYGAHLAAAAEVALSILVWGPSPMRTSPVARKRVQIKERLIQLGHNAMFSEDMPALGDGLSEKSKEFAQALSVHLIVILIEEAPGASAEAHDFCNHPRIAWRVYILVPLKYRDGYSAKGAIRDLEDGYGGVYWYDDGEIESCNVLTQVLKRVEARREIHLRYGTTDL